MLGGGGPDTCPLTLSTDTKMNRIHEIFHTLGLNHVVDPTTLKGIMKYPPQKPNQQDVNSIIYNPFMIERRIYK